jgi:hypothetical protein
MPAPAPRRAHLALAALGVAAVTALVFAPALGNDFVDWDDPYFVLTNDGLALPPLALLRWAFTTTLQSNWAPLSWLSLALDRSLAGGLEPTVFHATNVVLHAASAALVVVLLAALLRLAGREGPGALCGAVAGALLFALHPLRVESVAWVSERRDVLCTLFYLAAVLAHLRWSRLRDEGTHPPLPGTSRGEGRGEGRGSAWRWYLATLGLGAAALLSKSMAVTLPFALLVLDAYPLGALRRRGWRAVAEKLPLLALAAATALVTVRAQAPGITSVGELGVAARPLLAARAALFYAWKTAWPAGLGPLYVRPRPEDFPWLSGAASLAALVAAAALAWRARRRAPAWLAALAWYLVVLAPVIGLVHVGLHWAADRYTYLPGLAFSALAAAGVAWSVSALGPRLGARRALAAVGLAVALASAGLAAATVRQLAYWHDPVALWERDLELEPGSGWVRIGLARARWVAGDDAGALREAEVALDIAERRIPAFRGEILGFIAKVEARLGQREVALEALARARALGWTPTPEEQEELAAVMAAQGPPDVAPPR